MEGYPLSDPELGLSPLTGPPPVEVVDEILPTLEMDDAGGEVILIPDDKVGLIILVKVVPVPGKGTMEGAEKFPNPLGSPVSLGSLLVSYVKKWLNIRWWPSSPDWTSSQACAAGPSP